MVVIAWIKVGQLQKGKIFTVYSGESFDLKWYSDNVNWVNPVVIGQVSSIYFDRLFTCGFKAQINSLGGTSYQAYAMSCGIADTTVDFFAWLMNINSSDNPYIHGGAWINNNETQSKGHVTGFRGYALQYVVKDNYNYFTSVGNVTVRIGGIEVNTFSINGKNISVMLLQYTPYLEGEVTVSFTGSNHSRIAYIMKIFTANWETKSGILTIFANESQGVGY